ncbi:MAG: penicillin acylase family protein, partial [Vicinamibacteria bacterium]
EWGRAPAAPGPADRLGRLEELLSGRSRFTIEDFARIQADVRSVRGEHVLAKLLPFTAEPDESRHRRFLSILRSWDAETGPMSAGAAAYHAFYQALTRRLFAKALNDREPGLYERVFSLADSELRDAPISLFDRIRTNPAVAPLGVDEAAYRSALQGAIAEASLALEVQLGSGQNAWRWGDLHRLAFRHSLGDALRGWTGDAIGEVDRLLCGGSIPFGGDATTLLRSDYDVMSPYDVRSGSSYRFIADLGDLGHAHSMNPPGESGHFLSPHRCDQIEDYVAGRARPLWFSSYGVQYQTRHTLRLRPGYTP